MYLSYLLAQILTTIISIVIFIVFAQVVIHWLIVFEVIRVRNPQAAQLVTTLNNFTEKMYRPLRRYIPPIGGIDITPVVVIIGLQILAEIIIRVLY